MGQKLGFLRTNPNPNAIRGNSHWLLYEFDEHQYIDSSYVWNANRTGESSNGAKEVTIDYSTDGNTWIELGQYTFPKADETLTYSGFEGPEFGGLFIKKILITIHNTHNGGSCASLSEIQFKINQDACYGIVDVCGVCDGTGATTWYVDADNDGLGNSEISMEACEQPQGYVADNTDNCDNGILDWTTIGPLFADNGCTGCHGNGAVGGLNLTTYETTINGGNKCGSNILTGQHLVNIITTTGYDACGSAIGIPSMNDRTGGQFDATELAQIQQWIDDGALEFCSDYEEARVYAKVFLEGYYDAEMNEMPTTLQDKNLIPLSQPYGTSPWNYTGTETVQTLPEDAVDWILVILRNANGAILNQAVGFLSSTGELLGLDGTEGIAFENAVGSYISVHHRSHLAIVSSKTYAGDFYDFTDVATKAKGIEATKLVDGKYMLYAGDYDAQGIINSADYNAWQVNSAGLNQYLSIDGDGNGIINAEDYNLWILNKSKVGELEVRY